MPIFNSTSKDRTPPTKNKKILHNPFTKNIDSQILEGNSIPCKSINSFTDIATHSLTFLKKRQANDTCYCIEPGFIFHPHTKNNLITFRCFCFVYSPMRTFKLRQPLRPHHHQDEPGDNRLYPIIDFPFPRGWFAETRSECGIIFGGVFRTKLNFHQLALSLSTPKVDPPPDSPWLSMMTVPS